MAARPAQPSFTRSWLSWDTSAPVSPSARFRHAGTVPYSSTTGLPLSTRYSTCPCLITRPVGGSQVSVPPPSPDTGYEPAYPSVAATGVVAAMSSRTTGPVAAAVAAGPLVDAPGADHSSARHATAPPASTTASRPAATQRSLP